MEGSRTSVQPILPVFPCGLVMVLREMRSTLTTRIYKNGAQQSASGAVCQAVNGCAAQDWGQVLMCEGKSCSHFGSGTLLVMPLVCCDMTVVHKMPFVLQGVENALAQ